MEVGTVDGKLLGRIVGDTLGSVLGMEVGIIDGAMLGRIVGEILGSGL